MISIMIYSPSFGHHDNILQMGAKLNQLFGARLHFLQQAEEPNTRGHHLLADQGDTGLSGLKINEHRVTKVTGDIARSYIKAVDTDLVILQLGEDGFSARHVQAISQMAEDLSLPVLLLKNDFNITKLHHVLLILDAEYFGRGLQISKLRQLFESQNTKIHLLHVMQKRESEDIAKEQLRFFAKTYGITHEHVHVALAKESEAVILKICRESSIDLLCIRTNGGKSKGKPMVKDMDLNFLLETKTPILTFHLKHYD